MFVPLLLLAFPLLFDSLFLLSLGSFFFRLFLDLEPALPLLPFGLPFPPLTFGLPFPLPFPETFGLPLPSPSNETEPPSSRSQYSAFYMGSTMWNEIPNTVGVHFLRNVPHAELPTSRSRRGAIQARDGGGGVPLADPRQLEDSSR